jgi:hypothetical protein
MNTISLPVLAAYGAGLAVTLVLAAWLTPSSWWRRANLRALAVLGIGTAAIGGALAWLLVPAMPAQAALLDAAPLALTVAPQRLDAPPPGTRFRAFDDLNLRASRSVGARRLGVVPAGAVVQATGRQDGDWWEVSARIEGRNVRGWASSLWLRRVDERRN